MATIKNKKTKLTTKTTTTIIPSIIVPERKKNRPAKRAFVVFQNRQFFVNLYPNIFCSISELPDVARKLSNLFRSIINSDVRYQMKHDNLPSFIGVRNICTKIHAPSNTDPYISGDIPDYDCSPYLSLQMDNVQAAVFILRQFCKRSGQMPNQYTAVIKKGNSISSTVYDTHKSNPFLIETLCRESNIYRIAFGAVADINFTDYDFADDLLPIPYIRVSQKFGTPKSVHTVRKLKKIYELQNAAELERVRRERNKALARLEYRQAKAKLTAAHITRAYYGAYTYKGSVGNRYERARYRCALDARRDAELQDRIRFPNTDVTNVMPDAVDVHNCKSVEVAKDKPQSAKQLAAAKRITKKRIVEAFTTNTDYTRHSKLEQVDIDTVVHQIKSLGNMNIDENGQITLSFTL